MPTLMWKWFVSTIGQPSEADLIPELQQRNPHAFAMLVQQHTPHLLVVARRILRSEDDCLEALQDAYFSAYKALPQFHMQSKLGTWLHRIVVNSCLMKLRKKSRQRTLAFADILPHRSEVLGKKTSSFHAGEDAIERSESRSLMHDCIGQLRVQHQEVIRLRDLDELSTEEVADQLGITPGAVKTRLHRAHQALKRLITSQKIRMTVC
jgi:RNA polymerase sigma-70 factor, ECF subfamily